jgi:hypothetical protein
LTFGEKCVKVDGMKETKDCPLVESADKRLRFVCQGNGENYHPTATDCQCQMKKGTCKTAPDRALKCGFTVANEIYNNNRTKDLIDRNAKSKQEAAGFESAVLRDSVLTDHVRLTRPLSASKVVSPSVDLADAQVLSEFTSHTADDLAYVQTQIHQAVKNGDLQMR